MGFRIIVTKDNNELYLELNIFYNIGLIITGILGFIFNSFFSYIIWKEKLWKQSIQFVFQILSSGSGIVWGIRNIIISILNLTLFDSSILSYDFTICRIKTVTDVLIMFIFASSFGYIMMSFTLLIKFPFFFKHYLDNAKNNKYIVIFTIFIAIICDVMYIWDVNDTKANKNCNIYSFAGHIFEICYMGFIISTIIVSMPIFIYGFYNVMKLNLDETVKSNVIRLSNYMNVVYVTFWIIPYIVIIISFFLKSDRFFIGLFYDVCVFSLGIIVVIDFIIAFLFNKQVKDAALILLKQKNKITSITKPRN
uniref:G_PROTEIN_RECEP_F1_2 domain-containing protein n=1 Tax=Strongyloides venezuelensis TaxID=75913 RepID=A0A0K0FNS3_STRVS